MILPDRILLSEYGNIGPEDKSHEDVKHKSLFKQEIQALLSYLKYKLCLTGVIKKWSFSSLLPLTCSTATIIFSISKELLFTMLSITDWTMLASNTSEQ